MHLDLEHAYQVIRILTFSTDIYIYVEYKEANHLGPKESSRSLLVKMSYLAGQRNFDVRRFGESMQSLCLLNFVLYVSKHYLAVTCDWRARHGHERTRNVNELTIDAIQQYN